jgi:hypothetical protein
MISTARQFIFYRMNHFILIDFSNLLPYFEFLVGDSPPRLSHQHLPPFIKKENGSKRTSISTVETLPTNQKGLFNNNNN